MKDLRQEKQLKRGQRRKEKQRKGGLIAQRGMGSRRAEGRLVT
jgi:hypothetical protein